MPDPSRPDLPNSSRFRVMDALRRRGRTSRVEIAAATGLSRSAVTGLTQALIADRWIREVAEATDATGSPDAAEADMGGPARGRPRIMLEIRPDVAYVLGVKLSLHQMSCAIADFRGEVVHGTHFPFNGNQRPEIAADMIEMAVKRCLTDSGIAPGRVAGLCVGIPGYVSNDDGMCYWSPVFDRNDVAFAALLADRFDFRASIENDANLVTLAEHWFGEGKNLDSFAVVTVEHGIGMGLVTHDRLYRGGHGIGPEFGHSKLVIDGRPCRCGHEGCIEAYSSDYAILREVLPRFSLDDYNRDPRQFHAEIERLGARANAGDNAARAAFAEAGRHLGRGLGNLIATLNPPTIIVTGERVAVGDLMFAPMIEEARALQLPGNKFDTEIVLHRWGDDVWARGAAALVLADAYGEAPMTPVPAAAGPPRLHSQPAS